MVKDNNGITINIYKADLNFKKINFELFLRLKNFGKNIMFFRRKNRNFKENKILFL